MRAYLKDALTPCPETVFASGANRDSPRGYKPEMRGPIKASGQGDVPSR